MAHVITMYMHQRDDGRTLAGYLNPRRQPKTVIEADSSDQIATLVAVDAGDPSPPPWAAILMEWFDDVQFADNQSQGAAVLFRTTDGVFSVCFGHLGRHLIDKQTTVRMFGRRVVLNIVETDGITGLSGKEFAEGRITSRYASTRGLSTGRFDFDQRRNLLFGAKGQPEDEDAWGSVVEGSDALRWAPPNGLQFDSMPDYFRQAHRAYSSERYKDSFAWVDRFEIVTDEKEQERVKAEVCSKLRGGELSNLDLVPPDPPDTAEVKGVALHYRYPWSGQIRGGPERQGTTATPEVSLAHLVKILDSHDALQPARLTTLKIDVVESAEAESLHSEPVWGLIVGSVEVAGNIYALDDGHILRVDHDYVSSLDARIDSLDPVDVPLPGASVDEREADWLALLPSESGIVLDQSLVGLKGEYGVEACDVYLGGHRFMHVKRHWRSTGLNHLFGQARASAELWAANEEFRKEFQQIVDKAGGECPDDGTREVALVVLAPGKNVEGLSRHIPILARINLDAVVEDLKVRGFAVTFTHVNTRLRQQT